MNPELPPAVNDPNRARRIERSEHKRKSKERAAKQRSAAAIELKDQPFWCWIFAFACFVIPIISLGGLIPGAIGGGGGATVIAIYRNDALDSGTQFWMSIAVVVGCWTIFIMLAMAFLEIAAG